jgi:hypothetical protein
MQFLTIEIFVRCNFRLKLKLGGDLGLISQISMHDLVSRFDYFLYCKQAKEKKSAKTAILQKLRFSAVPGPIDLKLGGDIRTRTRKSLVCLFCLYYCLFIFRKCKQTTLYGFLSHLFIKCLETW